MATALSARARHAYSLGEEIANAVTHGIGALLAVAGLTLLVVLAVLAQDAWHIASAIVYGVSLVLLFGASTLYHSLPMPRAKHVFKILDHAAIYVLIAGSYTPFLLITLRDQGGLWMFAAVWAAAVIGVAVEAAWVYRPKWISALVYLAMGWFAVIMLEPLHASLGRTALVLILAGGIAYTVGTVFYVMKRVRYHHAVWHCFVLGASVCHFMAIALYVVP